MAKTACKFFKECNKIVITEWFHYFVIFCILVAGINVGMQTYPYYPKATEDCYDGEQSEFEPFPCKDVSPTTFPTMPPTTYQSRDDGARALRVPPREAELARPPLPYLSV